MKLRWALLFALVGVMSAQQFNNDIVPASPGLRIGHSNQRWNGFFRNMDIAGTCTINGVPCGQGGGGTGIGTYTIATLPPNPPINTYAFVTDANGPSCTIGGSSTTNLCRYTGFQWVIVSGGSGSAPSFDQVTGGINTSTLRIGTGGSLSTTGTGTITATNVPLAKTSVLHQFFTSYDSASKLFTSAQPTFDDLAGTLKINSILTLASRPFISVLDTFGAVDGLVVDNGTGGINLRVNGGSTTANLSLIPKGSAGQVIATNFAASGNNIIIPGLPVISSGHQCLQADQFNVVGGTGVECGAGGGGVIYPLTAPDGSSTSAQYTFANHPELGIAVALTGDKPQIRQVIVTGAGPGQTITLTVSSPINNLSWNAGDRIILTGLPSSPTDLTSLNITAPSFWTISSVTGTSPTGTATFSTAATTITPGTYAVTSGNAQIYGGFLVGRGFGFSRLSSSTTNPAQSGSIRFAARDAVKARAGQSDDTTLDIAHIRGSATISPANSPGTPVMTVNGAHSSGATTLSIARAAGTNWSATAGDQLLIGASNGDSDNQKYLVVTSTTVTGGTNTNVTITPGLKTALNGGELVVTRFIRTQVGEESGVEIPGDTELKGDLTLSSTKPTLIQVKKQSSTPTLNTTYDAGWYLDGTTNRFKCKLSVALGGGDCAPLSTGSGYSTIQDEAVAVPQQTTVNFTGAGVSCVDNPGSSRTDCTIPGGSGVTGSGTTGKVAKFSSSTSIGDSTIDDGVTTANTVTIAATGGLNISGSAFAGLMTLKGGTANTVVTSQVGFGGPATVTTPYLMVLPGSPSNGFLAGSNSTGIITEAFRSIAATSPVTVSNGDGASGNPTLACPTCGVTGTGLNQFAATTSAQLAGVLSDEIGSGKAVFASALQGTDVNVMTSGTVSGTSILLCTDANGGATTSGCPSPTASAGGSNTQIQYNNATNLGGISQWTTNGTTTITAGATGVLDLSAEAPTAGLKIPTAAGGAPLADGFIGTNSTTHAHVFGSNGTTMVAAAAATGTNSSTACAASTWVSTISGVAAPTCTQPAVADLSDGTNVVTSSSTATSNGFALGNGSKTLKFPAGFSTDGTSAATFGVQNTSAGKLTLSGSATVVGEIDLAIAGATANPLVIKPGANSGTVTLTGPTTGGTIPSAATSPVTLSAAGAIACATCTTSAAALTSAKILIGGGSQAMSASKVTLTDPATAATITVADNKTLTATNTMDVSKTAGTAGGLIYADTTTSYSSTGAGTAKQVVLSGGTGTPTFITFPDSKYAPAANCVNSVAGSGWSTGATPAAACRAGTNNKTAYLGPWGASDVGYIQFHIPADADLTTALPALMLEVASTDATNGHTIIMQESVACAKLDGSTTDDVAFNAARSFATVTLNGNANRSWNTTLTLNSTDLTGCSAPGIMWVKISRTTDTATNVEVYGLTNTIARLLTAGAN